MSLFRYEAVDKTGRVVHGAMDASDERQVADRLAAMGYQARAVYSTQQQRASRTAAARPPAAASRSAAGSAGVPISIRSVVPLTALATFFRQASALAKSGVPLYQSFADMAPFVRNRHLARVLPQMQAALQSGQKLSGAMAAHPGVFPVWATASVWAGEMSGRLDAALEEVAAEFEKEAKDARFAGIFWVITKLTVVACIFVLPICDISRWVPGMNVTLPQMIGNITAIIVKMIPLGIAVSALFVVWTMIKRIPSVRAALDALLLLVPVWGNLHKYRSLARFLHVLEVLYAAGISPGAAWDAASLTVKNNEVARRLKQARTQGGRVERASDLLQAVGLFGVEDVGMADVGEKAGRLPDALGQLARIYDERAEHCRSVGHMFSASLFIACQILAGGIAAIIFAYTYFYRLPKVFGLDF